MKQFLLHSSLLAVTFLAVFLWQKLPFQDFTAPLLGVLTLLYLLTTFIKRNPTSPRLPTSLKLRGTGRGASQSLQPPITNHQSFPISILLLNTCTLLLIFSTGGFESILFFLLYFLSFSIGFMLIPETVFVFAGLVFLIFLPESPSGNMLANVVKLASLVLICPLAYFFGKTVNNREGELKLRLLKEKKQQQAADQIIKDVSEIVESEGTKLKEQDVERLRDIVKESKEL